MVTGIGSVSSPGTPAAPMALAIIGTGEPQKRSSDNRRSNKPIMEKRRRARINNCLNELKTLILDAMKKDPARHSKLEKADILEMTVKHLENLQRQQVAMTSAADPTVVNKFRAGFSECASEVSRFSGLDPAVKRRLLKHLASCLTGSQTVIKQETQQVQVHILPSPPSSPEQQPTQNQLSASANGIYFTNGSGSGVQLVPTRLPNGDIALVLPAGHHLRQSTTATSSPATSPLPMLIPIPTRTASTASASSTSSISSGYDRLSVSSSSQNNPYGPPLSPAHSQNGFETDPRAYSPSLQKPLSLVMRKQKSYAVAAEEEKPWRPW